MSHLALAQVTQTGRPAAAPASAALLRRQCACGKHTIAGGVCGECQKVRDAAWPPAGASPDLVGFPVPPRSRSAAGRHAPTHARTAKSEAKLAPTPPVREPKFEDNGHVGAAIGGAIGVGLGAAVGGALDGGRGTVIGLVVGGGLGAAIGGLIGAATGKGIAWKSVGYASDAGPENSSTLEEPFSVKYKAKADKGKKLWQLAVDGIEGGANIAMHTDGWRNAFTSPPANEAEAKDAVTDMKGYYARGYAGTWHTEAASRAHEEHHYREWKGTGDHYWPQARAAIESLTAPLDAHPNEATAIAAMRAGPAGADAKIKGFHDIARQYWFTLSDGAGGRPFAAGQRVLNLAVKQVQSLAATKKWAVPGGTDNPSPEPPCYQPWLPYAP